MLNYLDTELLYLAPLQSKQCKVEDSITEGAFCKDVLFVQIREGQGTVQRTDDLP